MWPVGESGVKLQYKLEQTRPVNIARMRNDPRSVIGRYDWSVGVARWLSGRASYLRSKGRGFEPRPWRCCATALGKLFIPHCLIHAILHDEDSELLIKSNNGVLLSVFTVHVSYWRWFFTMMELHCLAMSLWWNQTRLGRTGLQQQQQQQQFILVKLGIFEIRKSQLAQP